MKPTFVDASFLIALSLKDDALHQRAIQWQRVVRGRLLSTEYVILEVFNALSDERDRPLAARAYQIFRQDPLVTILSASSTLMDEGIALFTERPDKRWGLTDCISFVVMTRFGATDALYW